MAKRKSKRKRKGVLGDHERKGKIFVPPIRAAMSDKFQAIRWVDNLLPEMIWIGLLLDSLSPRRAVEVAQNCAQETNRIVSPKKACSFAFVSEYHVINTDQAKIIRDALTDKGALDDLQSSLASLVCLYCECPLSILFDEPARERHQQGLDTSLNTLKRVVRKCLDRHSRDAMVVQATAMYLLVVTGKLKISRDSGLVRINDILEYPDTEESQKIGSLIRAGLNMPVLIQSTGFDWCSYFWQHGYEISVCEFPTTYRDSSEGSELPSFDELLEVAGRYKEELFQEVEGQWKLARLDLARPYKDEILGGLISRQARLAGAIAIDPSLWSFDIGRILLRCMVDTHITLVWLAKCGTEADFRQFIEYGLGQEKLLLEHMSSRLEELDTETPDLQNRIEAMRAWIDSQILTDLLPVNVGSWTRKSTRDMAEESDCLDIYNLSYTPLSSVVHGMWNTIGRMNLKFCINPLHRMHRVPALGEPPLYVAIPEHAAQVMDESFRAWEQAKSLTPLKSTSSERFREALEKLMPTS